MVTWNVWSCDKLSLNGCKCSRESMNSTSASPKCNAKSWLEIRHKDRQSTNNNVRAEIQNSKSREPEQSPNQNSNRNEWGLVKLGRPRWRFTSQSVKGPSLSIYRVWGWLKPSAASEIRWTCCSHICRPRWSSEWIAAQGGLTADSPVLTRDAYTVGHVVGFVVVSCKYQRLTVKYKVQCTFTWVLCLSIFFKYFTWVLFFVFLFFWRNTMTFTPLHVKDK